MDQRSVTTTALLVLAAGVLAAAQPAQAQVRSCDQLREDIASRAGWAQGSYRLEIVPKDEVGEGRTLGSCEAGARRVVVYFGTATPAASSTPASAAAADPAPAQTDAARPPPATVVDVPAAEPTAVTAPVRLPVAVPVARRAVVDEATLERYKAWIAEARAQHPYEETEDRMFQVMMCESRGNAAVVSAAGNTGLFQYVAGTWKAAWNTYAAEPILDAKAQIFATSLAWQQKKQGWWGCYKRAH